MRRMFEIITPENVHVEYEIAGFGSRFSAFFIDFSIQNIIATCLNFVLMSMVLDGYENSYFKAIIIIVYFLLSFGYFIFFEYKTNGQTPGKKIMKLRVIKKTGETVGIKECLIRNVLRILDILIIGAFFILFTKNYNRIGDIASNTIVVKEKTQKATLDYGIESEDIAFILNEYPVDNNEYAVLKDFVDRYHNINKRKFYLEERLNKYFLKKFNIDKIKYDRPLTFFKEILKMNEQKKNVLKSIT